MSRDLFVPSVIPWFRDRADEVMDHIHRLAIPNDTNAPSDMFRPAQVQNATTQRNVPTAAERLIRWDTLHPNDAFWNGFQPWVSPSNGNFPDEAFNLRQYVVTNVRSIFVGTARYYRNNRNALVRWQPRVTTATRHRFEYEIFAYGGIDVNHVLGDGHQYANQHEIAFPGGIRREFIRTAREYSGTQLVRIWDNPRFDNELNPRGHIPPLEALPPPIRGIPVPVIFFTEHDGAADPDGGAGQDELRRRRAAGSGDDLMRVAGDADVDDTLSIKPIPRLSSAAVLHPLLPGQAYFFCGNHYVIIKVAPGTTDDTIVSGPHLLVGQWPSFVKAGFGNIDAVLPDPRPEFKQMMYFFCMDKYVRINIMPGTTTDYIVDGPKVIVDAWPSLKKAGFKTIDTVLPNPANKQQAYFFSGEKYVRVKIAPGTNDDVLLDGPKSIVDNWPSLKQAGFKTVDVALPNPSDQSMAYFFSGKNYVKVKVNPGAEDSIVGGPRAVSSGWPSLHLAGFW
ncbi:Hemopexin-like domain-containing protein [Desarmillaria tabescens]|uniref:Hemopexin-like domain-containing protein n=1 Tax=Armillaria tabescens TaxID=1929756 RepID=A0AA39K8F7_ARMTA|nr:Hemopexin-like domain-containing protein [Desarmillaria tabescens]KAK0455355.1 Hemopexin-like domain-containing protein [Desarmillaria tabescens]